MVDFNTVVTDKKFWDDFYGSIGAPDLARVTEGSKLLSDKPTTATPAKGLFDFLDFTKGTSQEGLAADPTQLTPENADATAAAGNVDWENLGSRIVVIVLGFIFVATGLALFGARPAVQVVGGMKTIGPIKVGLMGK